MVERLKEDHDSCAPAMRKAASFSIGLQRHQVAGAFLHFLRVFQKMTPPADFERAKTDLTKGFLRGLLDADLQHALSTTFPPGDLNSISALRWLGNFAQRFCLFCFLFICCNSLLHCF